MSEPKLVSFQRTRITEYDASVRIKFNQLLRTDVVQITPYRMPSEYLFLVTVHLDVDPIQWNGNVIDTHRVHHVQVRNITGATTAGEALHVLIALLLDAAKTGVWRP